MSNLFLEHRGLIDISGSSKDQFGWFSSDIGGWFTSSVDAEFDPLSYSSGTTFVTWRDFAARSSDRVSRVFVDRKTRILNLPGVDASIRNQLIGQSDQRPQVFIDGVSRIQ